MNLSNESLSTILPKEIKQALTYLKQAKDEFRFEPVQMTGVRYPLHAKKVIARYLNEVIALNYYGKESELKCELKKLNISLNTVNYWLSRHI